jgi:hypothetical protein
MDANIGQLLELVFAKDKSMNMQQNLTTTIGGSDGYVSSFYYYQDKVATQMDVDLGIFDLPLGSKINTSKCD